MSNTTPVAVVTTISPQEAANLLGRNTHNRNISRALVNRLKRSLENNEWALNGEAIKIATDGTILDGQHRLTACVETNTPLTTYIITGLSPETQYTMDTGKARSLGDMLKLRGEKNYTGLGGVLTAVMRANKWGIKAAVSSSSEYQLTIKEQLDFLEDNPWVRDLERIGSQLQSTGLTRRVAALLFHVFSRIEPDDADYFFSRLKDGIGLEEGSPILALREWLRVNRLDKSNVSRANRIGFKGISAHVYMTAVTIKAWNAYREGRTVKVLAYRIGGANPETFPEPR